MSDRSTEGWVYVLTNQYMPGLVKIGRTTVDPSARAQQLYQTGVPGPFKVSGSVRTPDCVQLESIMHDHFSECRVSGEREFFAVPERDAVEELEFAVKGQINEWLERFLPNAVAVDSGDIMPEEHIELLSCDLMQPLPYVIAALSCVTAEELRPALERVLHRIDAMTKEKELEAAQ